MIDNSQREPQAAAITFTFFAIGQAFQWLQQPETVQALKDYLSIISFLVSIVVGVRTLLKKNQKSKD